jgi:cytoskeletal protein RodZ
LSYQGEADSQDKKMNSEKESRLIIEYLLGTLPEEEAERFDELSFTDDDFAEKLKTAENDLLDRYIQGELDGETRAKFESHYLASPLRREKLKFAEVLQIYAKQNIAQTKPEETKAGFFAFISNLFSGNKLQLGFAMTVFLLLILGGLWIFTSRNQAPEIGSQKTPVPTQTPTIESVVPQNQTPSAVSENVTPTPKPDNKNTTPTPKSATPAPTPTATATATPRPTEPKPLIASFVLTPPLRNSQPPALSIPPKTTTVALELQLETDDYSTYSISLVNSEGKSILQTGRLKASKSGKVLNLNFPAKLLSNGVYSLTVSGVKADGTAEIIGDYPFRAVLR